MRANLLPDLRTRPHDTRNGVVVRRRPLSTGIAILAACAAVLLVGLAPRRALAAGSWSLKTPSVEERNGEWHVKVRIDLPRPPPMMHTPMRFTFSKEAVDERAIMTKGAAPEHHRVVLDTAPKQIVSLDVDFADPAGKVFRSTYFEFDLARKDGYFEAGEYLVSLSGPDGDLAGTLRLTLKGDNPPVYRGAMDFTADSKGNKTSKPKGPKIESVNSGIDGGPEVAQNDTPSTGPASTEVAAEGPAPGMVPNGAYNKTAEEEAVQSHPKGCGCVAAGTGGAGSGGVLALGAALAGLAGVRGRATRRRRDTAVGARRARSRGLRGA